MTERMINRYNSRTIDKQMNNDRMMEHQNDKDRAQTIDRMIGQNDRTIEY